MFVTLLTTAQFNYYLIWPSVTAFVGSLFAVCFRYFQNNHLILICWFMLVFGGFNYINFDMIWFMNPDKSHIPKHICCMDENHCYSNSSGSLAGNSTFPVALICSQSKYLCQKHYSSCSYLPLEKKQLDTVEHIKAAQQPMANCDFSNRAILSQSEVLECIINPFYLPVRYVGRECWKRPMRNPTGVRHKAVWNHQDFLLKMSNKTRKLLYKDVQSVSRAVGVALCNSIPLSLPFFWTSHY